MLSDFEEGRAELPDDEMFFGRVAAAETARVVLLLQDDFSELVAWET